jgi:hypothetical protein
MHAFTDKSTNQARPVIQEIPMNYQYLALFECQLMKPREQGYERLGEYVSVHVRQRCTLCTKQSNCGLHMYSVVDFRGQQPEAGVLKKLS